MKVIHGVVEVILMDLRVGSAPAILRLASKADIAIEVADNRAPRWVEDNIVQQNSRCWGQGRTLGTPCGPLPSSSTICNLWRHFARWSEMEVPPSAAVGRQLKTGACHFA